LKLLVNICLIINKLNGVIQGKLTSLIF
jgi:hypothetical protein